MTPADYQFLQKLLKDRSGLDLSADKQYLVESRLLPIARKLGLPGIGELTQKIRAGAEDLARQVVEAMTTNETFFFRDKIPFDHLRETILPTLLRERASRRSLRIWSAACSTGQEPYSIAMCLKEYGVDLTSWRVEIVATDLSQGVLEKSKAGIFSQCEVQRGLPIHSLVRHFTKEGDNFVVKPALRERIRFRQANLLDAPPGQGAFDIVFCRNVLIYFDPATKTEVLRNLKCALADDGVLFLGGAETVVGLSDDFKPLEGCAGAFTRT